MKLFVLYESVPSYPFELKNTIGVFSSLENAEKVVNSILEKKVVTLFIKQHELDNENESAPYFHYSNSEDVLIDDFSVRCPSCEKWVPLRWKDYDEFTDSKSTPITLEVYSCESGGVYKVQFNCPHCNGEWDI